MRETGKLLERRNFLFTMATGLAIAPFAAKAHAQGLGLSNILGRASDNALDQLSQPGAFYGDPDIRIALPLIGGSGGALSSLFNAGRKAGLLDGLIRKLNDAAGIAAGEAKPIFRTAIDNLTLADAPGIVSQNDGATQYLQRSAGDDLNRKLRPLVDDALGDVGAYSQLDRLNAKHSFLGLAGIDRDGLGSSVTEQGLNGIFVYIGSEEAKFRANPLGNSGGLLKGLFGN
ncbi:DUF4197 domain-containing protein [Croceicoccus mobilis]|uniref:DUF4197 domain-containing protein n=1 Tax=Croceicoccus mobilis TaxID=1703339 RepID=A0A916YWU3_9SPHN|nr:DUF4197 domain-containing protein [Croceicoccus mobilis]GGD65025.1 hypothetical protein GCM10010990_13140 [Croceicoccus mobilis]